MARLNVVLALWLVGWANAAFAAESQTTEGFINAPISEVWGLFTTSDGLRRAGVAHAEVELKVGGMIRTHYDPNARLGDPDTIVKRILAFEPERMLALQIEQAPANLPGREVAGDIWTILYFTPSGNDMTHVRIVGLGYTAEPASRALRQHFEAGNRWTLDQLAKPYWPKCALCKAPTAGASD